MHDRKARAISLTCVQTCSHTMRLRLHEVCCKMHDTSESDVLVAKWSPKRPIETVLEITRFPSGKSHFWVLFWSGLVTLKVGFPTFGFRCPPPTYERFPRGRPTIIMMTSLPPFDAQKRSCSKNQNQTHCLAAICESFVACHVLSLAPKSCEPCGSCVWTSCASWPFDDLNHVAFCFFVCLFFAVLIVLLFLGRSAFLTRHCLLPGALTPFIVALSSVVWSCLKLESAFFVCP